MTTETAQYSGFGIKNAVLYAAGCLVARGAGNGVEPAVPGLVLFDISFGVQPADECDGLHSGAKGPEPRLGRLGRGQRTGVSTGRLRAKLRRMAFGAGCRSSVIGLRDGDQKMQRQQGQRAKRGDFREPAQARILADKVR